MKVLFKVLSVAFVILGLLALLGGAVIPGLVLCGLRPLALAPRLTTGEVSTMIRIATGIALGIMLAGCSSQLSWNDCMRDVDCKNATDQVMQANNVVHLTCPANPQKTTPACEAALVALNTAETAAFTKLKHKDAVDFSDSLLATR